MSMADIITLSSSPPTLFARSPTPVAFSSSPRKTRDKLSNHRDTTPNQFRPAQTARDGFPPAFTTARQVLGVKSSAENIPAASPVSLKQYQKDDTNQPNRSLPNDAHEWNPIPRRQPSTNEALKGTIIQILPSDVKRTKKVRTNIGLNLEKAATRRKDWTPSKHTVSNSSAIDAIGFGMKLQQSFGHADLATPYSVDANTNGKRRKIDPTGATTTNSPAAPATLLKSAKSTSKARNKSPTKKALTITGLTTSHYVEQVPDQNNSNLMMQFLASTQARMQADGNSDTFETSLKSSKSSKKKSRSRLKSPRTSIKTINEQDIVFASASQLARDESPSLLRDTAEAIRQSEASFNEHDLTQQTGPISTAPVSPEAGIARYRGMKNLWCAAHRDENDALLYRNDLFDEPAVRAALAGKDALIENGGHVQDNCEVADDSLDLLATLNQGRSVVCDIDDLITPLHTASKPNRSTNVRRRYSTSSQTPSKRMTASPPPLQSLAIDVEDTDAMSAKVKIPPKPNYASWTDEQLKDQVNEYGFKRLRARKSMIDKLDEYWAQKYGLDVTVVKAATKAASKKIEDRDHAHFLSKVHELAPRPQPKVSKSRSKRSESAPFAGVSKTKSKSKLVESPEDANFVEEGVFDIDEIDNSTALERLASIKPFPDEPADFLEPSTAPVTGTGVKAAAKSKGKRKAKAKLVERPLTPPPTMPEDPIQDSSPGFASPYAKSRALAYPTAPEDADTSLKSHIQAALLQAPPKNQHRDHQKTPTWHEKMLLYDPIVLEDFTAWLNTEGFNAIGVDDEIDAKEVKVWCEENGICCLWKGGWRGNKVKE